MNHMDERTHVRAFTQRELDTMIGHFTAEVAGCRVHAKRVGEDAANILNSAADQMEESVAALRGNSQWVDYTAVLELRIKRVEAALQQVVDQHRMGDIDLELIRKINSYLNAGGSL